MDIKPELTKQLKDVLRAVGVSEDVSISLERPAESSHGDYSSNVAFVLAKKLQRNPRELAEAIVKELGIRNQKSGNIDKVEVAGPGFINFHLSKEYYLSSLEQILQTNTRQFDSVKYKNKKIMVEFTDPNPFKEFHIGHLYSNIVGEALGRLFEAAGAEVWRVNYQGDVGLHVAKAVWGMIKNIKCQMSNFKYEDAKDQIEELEKKSLDQKVKFLGQAYVLGASSYEEERSAKEEIIAINKKIYEEDPQVMPLYQKGRQWSLEYFERIYYRLGTKFKRYYFESEAGKVGLAFVEENVEKGVFTQSDGAIIFEGKKYGLHNRVFINSLGLPTYEAKELGLAPTKYKDFAYDLSIIVTGNEVDEYFRVVLKALSVINPDLGEKTKHISHGMVRLPTGKMSSRTGDVITGESLLNEAKNLAAILIKEQGKVEGIDTDALADKIGQAAIKHAFLKSSIGREIQFDFDESVSFEGNSGPYLQYTFARIQSLLRKSQISNLKVQNDLKLESEEIAVLRLLTRFEEVVVQAAENYSPNVVTTYLYELASAFNLFYQKHPILNPSVISSGASRTAGEARDLPESKDFSPAELGRNDKESNNTRIFRLALSKAVGQTLKQGLELLGILAPEKM